MNIQPVDHITAETAHYVVCPRDRPGIRVVRNSTTATCYACARTVWVAPSSPLKPPRICIECAVDMLKAN